MSKKLGSDRQNVVHNRFEKFVRRTQGSFSILGLSDHEADSFGKCTSISMDSARKVDISYKLGKQIQCSTIEANILYLLQCSN